MIRAATSFSRNGLSDWLIQRVSAIILLVYVLFLLGFLVTSNQLGFQEWQEYIRSTPMRIFSVLALLSLLAHAWIGLWTVATDYVKNTSMRMFVHGVYSLILIAMLVWGIDSLWL